MAGEKVEDPIKKFEERYKSVKKKTYLSKRLADLAYHNMVKDVLMDENGEPDFDRLDKAEHQDKAIDHMANTYVTDIKKRSGPKGFDESETDLIIQALGGFTRAELAKKIRTHGKEYDLDQHQKYRNELSQEFANKLSQNAGAHLKDSDKGALVKKMGIADAVDTNLMRLEDALLLYSLYQGNGGTINKKAVLNYFQNQGLAAPNYFKKEEAAYKKKAA